MGQVINLTTASAVIPVTGGTGTYTVVSGDTLGGIAASYGVSLSALETANPQITNPDLIYAGNVLTIP